MKQIWFVFLWCAAFSSLATGFQKVLDLLGEKRLGETLSRRDLARLTVELVMVAFYGGLAGWAILSLFPDVKNELLGILSAVLGSGGPKVTRRFLTGMLERSLGVKIDEVPPQGREEEKIG